MWVQPVERMKEGPLPGFVFGDDPRNVRLDLDGCRIKDVPESEDLGSYPSDP